MSKELLIDMYYAVPELWYALAAGFGLLLVVMLYQMFKILRLKQKNYFVNRDRERYAETLYASQDGYFAFIYPDEKVNDPRKNVVERCSRRLAVIMNLPLGTKTSFEEILKNFYKDDVRVIQKYVSMLREEGVSFDEEFELKSAEKFLRLAGSRINGGDGNVYCDMIWFRDVSFETNRISLLEGQKDEACEQLHHLEDLIDNIPFPIWMRDEKLKLKLFNKKYLDFLELKNRESVLEQGLEITNINGENISQNLALLAHTTNKMKKSTASLTKNGERHVVEVIENPFHADGSLDKIGTVGALIEVTELDELKRNLKLHQNAQLEILGTLGTAFAVFNQQLKLAFYNQAFAKLWKLENIWLEQQPNYSMFLDIIREKRLLPEVPDYILFKNEEQKKFNTIIEPQEDMLHLPNGKTFRRVRSPHPMGGLIFAYEDISDKLEATSSYNALLSIQKEMLENLSDGILIFGSNGRLKFYNQAYLKLWNVKESFLQGEPNINELLDSQKKFFNKVENWDSLKKDILEHLLNITTRKFVLNRNEIDDIEVAAINLSDGSMMITYQKQ